jgi:hypothetical protein
MKILYSFLNPTKSFFRYAVELVLLFVLVFATVSTFAQERATAVAPYDQATSKLEFMKQSAVFNSGKIYLNWVTQPNSTDCIYVIERSADGLEFEPVGLKEGIGAGIELLYSWVDPKPVVGQNYYRIKQVNANGNLVAQTDVHEVATPDNPLFLDRGSRMVMVK